MEGQRGEGWNEQGSSLGRGKSGVRDWWRKAGREEELE